jgi:hypothetical protein
MLATDKDLQEATVAGKNLKAIESYLPQCP